MSHVTITYVLSEQGRKESLRQGGNGKEFQALRVERSEPEFTLALELASIDRNGAATVEANDFLYATVLGAVYHGLDRADPIRYDAPQTAAAVLADEQARRAAQNKKALAKITEIERRVSEWRALPLEERLQKRHGIWEISRHDREAEQTPEYAEAKALADRRNEEEKEQCARKEAEEKTVKEAGRARLRAWALAHGSELLHERVAGGFEWVGLAEKEYAEELYRAINLPFEPADSPDGYELGDTVDRTTPTLEEIQVLKATRERCAAHGATAELRWVKYQQEYDDGDLNTLGRAEIVVTVTCPTGREVERSFLVTAGEHTAKR